MKAFISRSDKLAYSMNFPSLLGEITLTKLSYFLFNIIFNSHENNPKNSNKMSLQVAQNKMLRMVNGSSLKDHVTGTSLLEKYNLPSVNQLSAEIKILETWKIMNTKDYPIELWPNEPKRQNNVRETRPTTVREWKEDSKTRSGNCCFVIDAARIWNQITPEIKAAPNVYHAKKVIKKYCKQLPTDH